MTTPSADPATPLVHKTADRFLRAHDFMERHVAVVDESTPLADLATMLHEQGVSGMPVIGGDGRLVGVVSKSDLARAIAEQGGAFPSAGDPREVIRAGDIMTEQVVTASEDETVGELASRMLEHGIHRLLVLRNGAVVGIVTATDLLAAVAEYESRFQHR